MTRQDFDFDQLLSRVNTCPPVSQEKTQRNKKIGLSIKKDRDVHSHKHIQIHREKTADIYFQDILPGRKYFERYFRLRILDMRRSVARRASNI